MTSRWFVLAYVILGIVAMSVVGCGGEESFSPAQETQVFVEALNGAWTSGPSAVAYMTEQYRPGYGQWTMDGAAVLEQYRGVACHLAPDASQFDCPDGPVYCPGRVRLLVKDVIPVKLPAAPKANLTTDNKGTLQCVYVVNDLVFYGFN